MNHEQNLLVDCWMRISRYIEGRDVKLKIKSSIKQLVRQLFLEFGITREEIKNQLFLKFRVRERHRKYDPCRSNLEVYVAYFAYYALLDLLCECKLHKQHFTEIPLSQLRQGDSVSTIGRPVEHYEDQSIDGLVDRDTPQDLLIGKELFEIAQKYFGKEDLAVILGAVSRKDEAKRLGLDYHTYCKRVQRKVEKFRCFLKSIGYLDD